MKDAAFTTYPLFQFVLGLPLLLRPPSPPVAAHRLVALVWKSIHSLAFTPNYPSAFLKPTLAKLLWKNKQGKKKKRVIVFNTTQSTQILSQYYKEPVLSNATWGFVNQLSLCWH